MSHRRLISALAELIRSAERIVGELDPELYRRSPEPLAQGSIGAHLRHCLETCALLCEGVPEGAVDYGARGRDAAVETDPERGLAACAAARQALARLAELPGDTPLRVTPERTATRAGAASEAPVASSLGREVEALRSHTLHHFAMVALFLRHFGLQPDPAFGVAPSTLAHWEATRSCAPLPG